MKNSGYLFIIFTTASMRIITFLTFDYETRLSSLIKIHHRTGQRRAKEKAFDYIVCGHILLT